MTLSPRSKLHQLKNHLATIRASAQFALMVDREPSSRVHHALETIIRETDCLNSLLENWLKEER